MRNLSELNRLLAEAEGELQRLDARRAELLAQVAGLKQERATVLGAQEPAEQQPLPTLVTNHSAQAAKVALFRSLFRGRAEVYARRFESLKTGKAGYQPVCRNEWVAGICEKPQTRCDDCGFREFLPVSDDVVRNHLLGTEPQGRPGRDFTIGVYPMLPDETCWFLAADFDKATWQEDAIAFLETCALFKVPAVLERSRSGNGGHCWFFFAEPVPAASARKMGAYLLTQTMERRPEIGLDSYDRFFPSQDTLPKGGFGNLIALPLQKKPRENGNSLFLDEHASPYPDQWAFLSSIRRMTRLEVEAVVTEADAHGEFLGIRMPVTDEDDARPWVLPPSGRHKAPLVSGPLPAQLDLVLGNQIYVPKADFSPSLRNRLIRLAAFQNPEFYQAQAMRLSTFGKPRIISCCEDYPQHLGLPRGCLDELLDLLKSHGVKAQISDQRLTGTPIEVEFHGTLRTEQQQATDALLLHDIGVLAASTAFGKTVIGAYLIAQRKVNALVIVHRRQLLDQWLAALGQFLGLEPRGIGQIGGGKHKPTGRIDVAMIQSLNQDGVIDDIVGNYGHVIVDECHHVSAVSGEGFDDERLDTLFLALPIAWRGTLAQYAGRLHRLNAAKRHVIIYDYVDAEVPVLARMYAKRRAGYRTIGYEISLPPDESQAPQLALQGL